MSLVRTKCFFVKSIYYEKIVEKIVIFFKGTLNIKPSFFEKVTNITFFQKYVSVTQNRHFFPKNIGEIFDKNSENYVLLCENTFHEK